MQLETATYLGPARVIEVCGPCVRLRIPEEEVPATLALAYPYLAAPGDLVLAVGYEGNWYVIGVLTGTGKTSFVAPGDLELRAPNGKIDLFSTKEVNVAAPRVTVRAGTFETLARRAVERFGEAFRWVTGLFRLRSGRVRQEVEGKYALDAGRIDQRAEQDVKIDGSKIHLG